MHPGPMGDRPGAPSANGALLTGTTGQAGQTSRELSGRNETGPESLARESSGPIPCPRGDLNPHALIRALAPQASASANSATRTSAG